MPRTYESTVVDQQIGPGVDEDTDPRYASKPDIILNCRYNRTNQLSKRAGCKQIAGDEGLSATWGQPTALGNLNKQLCHSRSGVLFGLTEKVTGLLRTWTNAGPISRFKIEEYGILTTVSEFTSASPPTIATLTSGSTTYRCVATPNRIQILDSNQRIIDSVTSITGPTTGGPVTRTMALAWPNGNRFVLLFDEVLSAKLYITTTTNASTMPPTLAATAIITDLNDTAINNRYWDACIVGDFLFVAYLNKGASNRITVFRYNLGTSAPAGSVTFGGALDNITMVALCSRFSTELHVQFASTVPSVSFNIYAAVLNLTPAVTTAPTLLFTTAWNYANVPVATGGSCEDGNNVWHTFQTPFGTRASQVNSVAVQTQFSDLVGHIPISKPFMWQGSCYQNLLAHRLLPGYADLAETGATTVLVEWTPKNVANQPQLHGIIGPLDVPAYQLAKIGSTVYFPRGLRQGFTTDVAPIGDGNQFEWVDQFGSYAEVSLRHDSIVRMTPNGQTTVLVDGPDQASSLISGGANYAYDGSNTFPVAFHKAPALRLVGTGGGGSGQLTGGGKYFFSAAFVFADSRGNIYRSEIAVPISVTLSPTDNSATIEVTLFGTWQHNFLVGGDYRPYYIECYRTVAGGATLYLDSLILLGNQGNNPLAAYGSVLADSAISSRPIVYTNNAVKGQQPSKGAEFVFYSGERVWGISSTGDVYHSGSIIAGDGYKFNLDFTLPPFGNDLAVGGGDLDGTPIIFRQREIWAVLGDGPDDTGVGNFTLRRVAADTGCDNPRSVVLTPDGLEFTFQNRMYILTRGLQLQRVSDSIQSTLAESPIVAATRVPEENEVRFLQAPVQDRLYSPAVVQDVRIGTVQNPVFYTYRWQWDAGASVGRIVGACLFEDQYTMISENGFALQEDATYSYDTTIATVRWIDMRTRGSWSRNGLMSFMRVWRGGVIFDRNTPADMTLSIYNDYSDTPTQTHTFTAAENASWVDRRAMLRLAKQRGYATRIEFADAPPNGVSSGLDGQGFVVAGFSFEGQQQGGATRLPAGQRG